MRTLFAISIIVLLYAAFALLNAGLFYASEQASYPRTFDHRDTLGFALTMGLLYAFGGPVGSLFVWLMCGFGKHGWRLFEVDSNS